MRKERFKDVLRKHADIFNDDYLEAIQKRRATARSLSFKLFSAQLPILIFLVLSLIPVDASVTIFGVSPKASKNLREVLIVASALVGVFATTLNHYVDIMNDIIGCFVDRRSKGDKEVSEFLGLGLGTNLWFLPGVKYENASVSWGFLALISMIAVLGISVLLCTFFGTVYVHFLVLKDIYINPSFSHATSVAVISFVLACDVFTLLLAFLSSGGMPLQDLTNMLTMSKISEKDPDRAAKIYRAMALEHLRRPWFIRLISRMKMPKRLPPG
ncbi:hypothetical protein [Bradyrhizobium guangdongense]